MTQFIQLIDFDGNFGASLKEWLNCEGLSKQGFDYSVVTVLGCQSSGKSTLLNALFSTKFPVMDASKGRHQTTKGLWLARDHDSSTLILDAEGTDSKERGEDRLTFEHRAALFSLALADCVLVNMWYHDLGRYTASNYGLLKTVLGVNLELFQQQTDAPKTTMIFVIRDYNEALTPLDKLTEMIEDDIRLLWKDTTKPEKYKDSVADQFFTFITVGLPSKVERPDDFSKACTRFRNQWLNEWRPETYSRQIPADGFAFYAQTCWGTILKSSVLDIPSQKEMLATYRCEELKADAINATLSDVNCLMMKAQEGNLPTDTLEWAVTVVKKALELYDGPASRYQASVFTKKRTQLVQHLQHELQKVVDIHLVRVRHHLINEATTTLRSLFPDTPLHYFSPVMHQMTDQDIIDACTRFKSITGEWKKKTLETLQGIVEAFQIDASIQDEDIKRCLYFDSVEAQRSLEEAMDSLVQRARERQAQALEKQLTKLTTATLGDFEALVSNAELTSSQFWDSVIKLSNGARELLQEKMFEAYTGLLFSEADDTAEVQRQWDTYISGVLVNIIGEKLRRISDWLSEFIFSRFQRFFNHDEQDVPRQWQDMSSEKIKEIYLAGRDKALVIVDIFTQIQPKAEDLTQGNSEQAQELAKMVELPGAKMEQILTKAHRQMQRACQEAQLIQATGGRPTRIPWWMWILLLAFGYDEITAVLFSPFALIFAAIVGAVLLLAYYTQNLQLPLDLARQALSLLAAALIPLLSSFQVSASRFPVAPGPAKQQYVEIVMALLYTESHTTFSTVREKTEGNLTAADSLK